MPVEENVEASPALKERTLVLEGRTIHVDDVGVGAPIVFVHGVWATGGLWDPVVALLARRFRCVVPTLPLGVHKTASPANVDHSPLALAKVLSALFEALDLRDVTLVGNDTGGALAQLVVANFPERVGRVVLTNCDAYDVFPPKRLLPVYRAARSRALWWLFAQATRLPRIRRRFWSLVAHAAPDRRLLDMLFDRFADRANVREDLRLTLCAVSPAITQDAARAFASYDRDVLILWGADDYFFPVSLARRLAADFPRATLKIVPDARLFVPTDAPNVTASEIAAFATRASEAGRAATVR